MLTSKYLIFHDKCSYHLSPKKSLFIAKEHHHRKTQLDTQMAHGEHIPTGHIYITAPACVTPGTLKKSGQKIIVRPRISEVLCDTVSSRNGCIDKTITMAIPIEMLK